MKYRQILCIFAHETYGSFVNEEMFDRIIKIDKNVFSTIEEIEM